MKIIPGEVVRKAVFLLFLLISIFGCGGGHKEPGRHYNAAQRFSIRFPKEWNKTEPLNDAIISVQSPEKSAVISILVEKLPAGYTLTKAIQHIYSRGEARNIFYSERGETLMDGLPAHWLKGISGNKKFTYLLYFTINFNRLYSVEFTAEAPRFDAYKSQFDNIIQSFNFE